MRWKSSLAALSLAGILFAPAPASADEPAWSFSVLGGLSQFSNKLRYPTTDTLSDAPVVGIRLARTFGEYFSIEAAGSWASTHGVKRDGSEGAAVTVINASGSLIAQLGPQRQFGAFYIGAGGGYDRYNSDVATEDLHFGTLEALAGWKKSLGRSVAIRLEARNILNVPKENMNKADKSDQQYMGGLTFGWGGTPKDTDADGVPDKKDQCPGTPAGATVNVTGCPTDADGDGVWDGLDQCANTPKGATVDAKGCPSDTDGDGIVDGLDACADTPNGATVDVKGCPMDSDGDGVFDGLDQCANTPRGAKVDGKGCPMDTDGDGVPDGLDKCTDTAPGLRVDASGCPIEVSEKETQLLDTGLIRLQNVNFETGKSRLLPESFAALDEVGAILVKWPQLKIEIGGHTDSRGSAIRNQALSEDRAGAVKDYLIDKFATLDASQLSVRGYGFSKPLVTNTTALNMAKNRRVEFKVTNRESIRTEIERRRLLQK